jgi:hypothetical protein
VHTILGILGLAVFIPCVIALAAGITWLVVKVSPSPEKKQLKQEQQQAAS